MASVTALLSSESLGASLENFQGDLVPSLSSSIGKGRGDLADEAASDGVPGSGAGELTSLSEDELEWCSGVAGGPAFFSSSSQVVGSNPWKQETSSSK